MKPTARRGWYIFGVVATVVVGVIFALACLGGVIGAASTSSERSHNGETFGGDIALAIVSALVLVVCVVVGAHLEHRLRRHQRVANSWSGAAGSTAEPGLQIPRVMAARKIRYSPVTVTIYFVVILAVATGLVIGAVVVHARAERSSRTQHEGIARTATVVRVDNHYHSSRGGGYYTADVLMSLTQPFDGRTGTVVHYPGRVQEPTGAQLRILIDPSSPGYAELPGSPSTKTSSWILLLIFAIAFAGLDIFLGWVFIRFRRRRRSVTSPGMPQPAVSA